MAERVQFDPNTLTLDEIELIEDICDVSFEDIQSRKVRLSKYTKAFVLVALRRTNPNATLEDAGSVTAEGLDEFFGGSRPLGTPKAAPPASSRSSRSRKRPG